MLINLILAFLMSYILFNFIDKNIIFFFIFLKKFSYYLFFSIMSIMNLFEEIILYLVISNTQSYLLQD